MVAFSLASKPIRPISWESDRWTPSPSSAPRISAARCSNSPLTGEKTEEIATERSPRAAMSAATRFNSSGSRSEMGVPSYSCPPWHR